MTNITLAIALLLVLISEPAYADGGGPILLLVSVFLFVVGQIWIVLSEFVYMKLLHRGERIWTALKVVVSMNLISMVIGASRSLYFSPLLG